MAVVDLRDDGSARYSFYLRDTADWQWVTNDLPVAFDPSVTALHAGSMALLMPPGGVVLEAMLERERSQRVVSIDPNVRAIDLSRSRGSTGSRSSDGSVSRTSSKPVSTM